MGYKIDVFDQAYWYTSDILWFSGGGVQKRADWSWCRLLKQEK